MEGLVHISKGFLFMNLSNPKESLLMQKESVMEEKGDQKP